MIERKYGIVVREPDGRSERFLSCNCCDEEVWTVIEFRMGNMGSVVRLCLRHLSELARKTEKRLGVIE